VSTCVGVSDVYVCLMCEVCIYVCGCLGVIYVCVCVCVLMFVLCMCVCMSWL